MTLSTEGIKVSDVRLINPLAPSLWKSHPKFQIKIESGNQARTGTERAYRKGDNDCVIWDESFIFTGEPENTLLTFTVIRTHRFRPDDRIGSCEGRVIELLETQSPCKLDVHGKFQLTFKIEKSSDVTSEAVEQALVVLGNLANLEVPRNGDSVTSATQASSDNEATWSSFIGKFEVLVKVVDEVSEISPYVKVAWGVLSVIPKTIIAKKNRDDKIKQLYDKLEDVYDYITDAKRLSELTQTQSKTLSAVVLQTTECAYFIRAYCTEDTVKNTLKGIIGSADAKIQAFNDKLDRLMNAMKDSINLETGIVTLRVSEKIIELSTSIYRADIFSIHDLASQDEIAWLEEIPYESGAGYFPHKECLPGTRQKLINEIFEWANDDSSTQILVLSGQAGIGKSAIAHTVAKLFKEQNRLGSMFCFSQGFPGRRNRLFSTISRNLADSDIMWRKELVKVIGTDSDVRKKEDARTQFDELIIKPSRNVATIGPVVIVVDALDESGDRNERGEIMYILLNRWTELPKNYRLIVTTRPEQDIEEQCQKSGISCKRMGDIDADETCNDIEAYVSKRLESISLILDKIDKGWRIILARRAQGLFQWAQTACGFIDNGVKIPELLQKNWETCVSNSSLSLYALYGEIISNQPESRYEFFQERFKAIVGAIITAREPLSIHALQNIFKDDIQDIRSILTPFGSFFSGIHDPPGLALVRPLHTSLFDFFMAEKIYEKNQQNGEKINEYYIDTSNQSRMTLGCLKVMNRMLRFNICQLETSHQDRWDVHDLDSRVEKAIPLHLSYSCRFWTCHLRSSPISDELIHEIRILMDDHLLYYFEVLSLLNVIERGCVAMHEIADWCRDADSDLAENAMDAWKFGYDFDGAMTSTPHVYLSALPFAPRDSFVSRKYLERYPGLFTFDVGQPVNSSFKIRFMPKNFDIWRYDLLVFSQKGSYYATASIQKFDVWNYVTRKREVCWEMDQTDHFGSGRICSIVFSPDGESLYCCLERSDILIWNMVTKENVIERYGDIVGAECRHCTISSNGHFIVLRTQKEVLVVERGGRRITKRFEEEYYFSAISPNGNWIALYSYAKREVYIWNTRDQTQHIVPCHDWWDLGLTLTDSYIAFHKDKTTIEIRGLQTITKLIEIQHESVITSFCISPDDQYILVTSAAMYSIFSVSTGESISQCYVDNLHRCSGFSHDSKMIALCTRDGTLHIREWNESIYRNDNEIEKVYKIWICGSYLILRCDTILYDHRLRILDITTTNAIIFEVKIKEDTPVGVFTDEDDVRVVYITSDCELCLWDDKRGGIVVDGSAHSITALICSGNFLIFGHQKTINIWDICIRQLVRNPIDLPYELKSLLPVRACSTRFAVKYDDQVEVRDCESGERVGETFTFNLNRFFNSPIAVSATRKHLICTSQDGAVSILDPTGAKSSSIPFSYGMDTRLRLSPNGRYLTWISETDRYRRDEFKLFDLNTETLLTGPSFDQPIHQFWFSNDSKSIIIMSYADFWKSTRNSEYIPDNWKYNLDIWDIQSKNTIIKTIRYPSLLETATLDLSKMRLAVIATWPRRCHVCDLGVYEMMSSLYNSPQLAADHSDIDELSISSKTETLDYALMAWKKASFPVSVGVDTNGWLSGPQGELLFWVPEHLREGFWIPCMTHLPYQTVTKLNFTNFVHGSDWTKCKSAGKN